jgi:hypothetical protein
LENSVPSQDARWLRIGQIIDYMHGCSSGRKGLYEKQVWAKGKKKEKTHALF